MRRKNAITLACACIALISATSCLASCSGGDYEKLDLATQGKFDYATIYKARGYNSVPHSTIVDENYNVYREVTDVRLLVIPVEFTDYTADKLPQGREGTIDAISTLMFGEAEDTAWESLRSYYYSSSFGECNVTGVVAPWYQTGYTVQGFADAYSQSGPYTLGIDLYYYYTSDEGKLELAQLLNDQEGYNFATDEEGNVTEGADLSYFDANDDYYVDAVIMLYSCPEKIKNRQNQYIDNDLYWAWTSSGLGPTGTAKNTSMDHFFWTSIYTFYEAGTYENGKWRDWTDEEIAEMGSLVLDAHTLVHEFGHIISMYDYYSYDANSGADDYYAMGGLDMMDFNIGDHNSVSKAWYGWTSPYIIDHPGTITLNCATTTGDFCIVPIQGEFKGSLCSQYIAIELISNDGVAYLDSQQQLHGAGMGTYPYYYSETAVRVMHVDARPGYWRYDSNAGAYYFGGFREDGNTNTSATYDYVEFACSNTASRSCYSGYKFIEMMPSTGRSIRAYGTAKDEYLWHEGDKFGYGDVYKNYMMNGTDGSKDVKFGYKFTIDKIDQEAKTVTITFKKG